MNGAITTEFDPDAEPEKVAALMPQIQAYAVADAVRTRSPARQATTYEPTAGVAEGRDAAACGAAGPGLQEQHRPLPAASAAAV